MHHCPEWLQVDLRQYINELMVNTGGCASSGFPIASCKIYPDKSYAFLEFRSVEEASNCMAFDGVAYKDSYLRVRPALSLSRRGGSWTLHAQLANALFLLGLCTGCGQECLCCILIVCGHCMPS